MVQKNFDACFSEVFNYSGLCFNFISIPGGKCD